jgi:hypothetical protein
LPIAHLTGRVGVVLSDQETDLEMIYKIEVTDSPDEPGRPGVSEVTDPSIEPSSRWTPLSPP